MGDIITIAGLRVPVFIGVPDRERRRKQTVTFYIGMETAPFTAAAREDAVARTVDYHEVAETVKAEAGRRARKLLETLGEDVAAEILKKFPITTVTVEIRKFILRNTDHVSVRLTRRNRRRPRGAKAK
jgi:7,8-dihydroneopterin aldolase/epimerase/oxygenase